MVEEVKRLVYSWAEAHCEGEEVGGKGLNLARLYHYGFSIPKGFLLSICAYESFVETNGLADSIRDINEKVTLENLGSKETVSKLIGLRERINAANLSDNLLEELQLSLKNLDITGKSLAVRSSASHEDSKESSFAGIHDSFLNVIGMEQLIESIKGCYASLWSPRAVGYRRKLNISDTEIKQAVVVMEMVKAKASGVAFSCNPLNGRRDNIVINANYGLGESVVSGSIEPDQYKLTSKMLIPKIEDKHLGKKEGQTEPKEDGGIRFVKSVDSDHQQNQVLSDEEIGMLGLLVQRVSDVLGDGVQEQDVEWVYTGNEFILVQARPVTKLPKYTYSELKAQPDIWSNANMKDAMPMVQTIFGWQFVKLFSEAILSTPLKLAGYKSLDGLEYARLFKGRGYFNLSLLQWGFFDALGVTPKETNTIIGGHQPEITVPTVSTFQKLQKLTRTLMLLKAMLQAQSKATQAFQRVTFLTQAFRKKDLTKMEDSQLVQELENILNETILYTKTIALVTNLAGMSFNNLAKVLDKDFPQKGFTTSNKLFMGRGKITSAEHGYRLMELADLVKEDPEAADYFTSDNFNPAGWEELSQESSFKRAFLEFLDEYGHRGIYEGDISNPRWREDPTYLLNHLRSIVTPSDSNFNQLRAHQADVSEKAWQEIMQKIPFYRRGIVKVLVNKAVKHSELREMAKSQLVRTAEPSRLIALEMGKRFVRRGLLSEVNDIFHCYWSEVVSILKGRWDGQGIKTIVEARKEKMEGYRQLTPPDTIIDGIPQDNPIIHSQNSKDFLKGLGVATGRVEGIVRVITHPNQGEQLKPGEILVAPTTDPAWTPLFLKVAGIVMETGGFLSHGAIVSREYGIPAVVNIPGVMKRLKDGDIVIVDGDEGKVYLR